MKKINIIGTTGSGKSTFAKQLATKLNYPYISMDQLFWKPNWEESTDEEFFSKLSQALNTDAWVLDGNYNRTKPIKWNDIDTIIWIDYSYVRTLVQLFTRTLARVISTKELWPETGNRESFRKSFMSRSSIFIWFFKNYKKNKVRYAELIESPNLTHIKFVRICDPEEARIFIHNIRVQKPW